MQYIKLNNGVEMPSIGYGVFQVPSGGQTENAVCEAIRAGYRLIDTAAAYKNEESVGKAISAVIREGVVSREELFITTKVWVQDQRNEDAAYEAVRTSLKKLKLHYVDLILLHQPMGDYFAAYRGIERAYKDALVRAIGVSNFYPEVLTNFCETVSIIPAVNQVELHPFFVQTAALENMKTYGVTPQAWGPLAEGKHGIFTDETLTSIGKRYSKSAAQVALRWNVQRGVSVLPKSVHADRIRQNLDILDFALTDEEMARISSMDLGCSEIVDHRSPEFVKWIHGLKVHD